MLSNASISLSDLHRDSFVKGLQTEIWQMMLPDAVV